MWPPFETNVPYFEPGPGLSPLLLAMIGCSIGCIYYLLSIVCLPETMICVPLNLSLPERRDGVSCLCIQYRTYKHFECTHTETPP